MSDKMKKVPIVRVLRLLEYIGSKEFVESSLSNRSIKGEYKVGQGMIREGFIGEFPEKLQYIGDGYGILIKAHLGVKDEIQEDDKE